jgi:hypothetical protein
MTRALLAGLMDHARMPTLANAKQEAVAQAYIADPEKIGWRAYLLIHVSGVAKRSSGCHAQDRDLVV